MKEFYECYNSGGGVYLSIYHKENFDYVVTSEFVECISMYDMSIEDFEDDYYEENMIFSININDEDFDEELSEIYKKLLEMLNSEMEFSKECYKELGLL